MRSLSKASILIAGISIVVVAVGCTRPRFPRAADRDRPARNQQAAATDTEPANQSSQSAGASPADRPASSVPGKRAERLPAANSTGRPSRVAVCGHAVAFAGCKPSAEGNLEVLLCDPGDNAIQGHPGHAWNDRYHSVPLHFGKYRPSIVLLPAGTFTITGAIVVRPADAVAKEAENATRAAAMPDLSQDFGPGWPGLCGPTSAADVLFDMAARQPELLQGHPRGPSAEADEGCAVLVTGGREVISDASLAGRMGIGPDGNGATSEGICSGLASWLDEREPGQWRVELDWLDDRREGKGEQRRFFAGLSAALETGGGAILCLWPGSEFVDAPADDVSEGNDGDGGGAVASDRREGKSSVDRPAASSGATSSGGRQSTPTRSVRRSDGSTALPPLPPAEFPNRPDPVSDEGPTLPGAGNPSEDRRLTQRKASRKLEEARRRFVKGEERLAMELASQAAELLAPHVGTDSEVDATMREAVDLCSQIERKLPRQRSVDSEKPTKYE